MRFPETLRNEEGAHGAALRRRDSARDDELRLVDDLSTVEGTNAEPAAWAELDSARAAVAAREAWLAWVELGSN
jgi:hypothetical protein